MGVPLTGVIKQGFGCELDRLHEPVHERKASHRFLGNADVWDDYRYSYQRVADNVAFLVRSFSWRSIT